VCDDDDVSADSEGSQIQPEENKMMTPLKFASSLVLLATAASAWSIGATASPRRRSNSNKLTSRSSYNSRYCLLRLEAVQGADIEQPTEEETLTLRPGAASSSADISLIQARGKVNEIDFCIAPADVSLSRAYGTSSSSSSSNAVASPPVILSLTRALNNASNRAVRRILLARSWPSVEALNLSLRQVAAAEKQREEAAVAAFNNDKQQLQQQQPKCPVPRPILNVLMRRRRNSTKNARPQADDEATTIPPNPRSTVGRTDEEYVADQIKNFQERYGTSPAFGMAQDYLQAILSLATSGVESETAAAVLVSGVYDESYKRVLAVLKSVGVVLLVDPVTGRRRIASKLIDQDICLSVLDKIQMQREKQTKMELPIVNVEESTSSSNSAQDGKKAEEKMTNDDLGGVLLSASEPSMTRQLNSLANIVERALLFGGDQELLVLAETLDADLSAFVDRWYPGSGGLQLEQALEQETRPGVQFLNCLIQLLRDCYDNGVVVSLEPALSLPQSYANAYERLVASAVELGSGYLRPVPSSDLMAFPKPRTAQEELGRFAVWESTFRAQGNSNPDVSKSHPDDMVGTWEVRDEIGGETIGMTTVTLGEKGSVQVNAPLDGLRWRLDPGPTHLDTCTFQVLSSDGTILQYRGFIDRGSRLEAKFSKRQISIRGSVMFQMRNGNLDYYKDMLPVNYRTGTTKFVMTKIGKVQ
jgi:hypothetical protein